MVDMNAIEDFMTSVGDEPPLAAAAADAGEAAPDETVVTEFADADHRVHRLRTPVTRNGERITILRLRPPTLVDIDDWSSAELSNRDLLVRLSGMSAAVLKALAWEDAEAVMAMFRDLVPDFVFADPKGDA